MSTILLNEIKRQIIIRYTDDKQRREITERILRTVYHKREKTFTRILNNTSQPTLEEAATIAQILGVTIDDLFQFEKTKIAS